VWLVDLDSIDSSAQSFTANVFILLRWHDPRLAHDGDAAVRRPLAEVWHPRVVIANEIGLVRRTLDEVVEVASDGEVAYRQRYVGAFSQPLYVDEFPFDRHTFRLHLVATGYSPEEVRFVADPQAVQEGLAGAAGIAEDRSIPDWNVESWSTRPMPYAIVASRQNAGWAFEFEASRKSGYYVWKVILPLILIVGISWSVFWIDPENAGTQVGVATTTMLTLIAYRFAVDAVVPRVPYMTRLDLFISGSTVLIFLSLIEVLVVIRLVRRNRAEAARRVDRLSRLLFPFAFAVSAVFTLRF